ncbi:hypothetical protein [Bifidobacterium breve]|uniref:hypothetical protein n=1 Tax=Bifidobacterium breve TaxID=1685 RepID=UPI00188459AF|nr:hypothetical protein [Bifidobacterium breve]
MADRFWLDLLDHRTSHASTDMLCGLTLVAVAGLAWRIGARHASPAHGEEHARPLGRPADIKLFIDPDPATICGSRAPTALHRHAAHPAQPQVLLLGSSGPARPATSQANLLGADMNWAVTDPKGELNGHRVSDEGARYAVHALDLVDLTVPTVQSMRYIDPAEPQLAILA